MRIRVLAAVCAASIGLAACGGDDESAEEAEEEGPAEVTEQFFEAFVSGDGETTCALFSEAAVEEIELDAGGSCLDSFGTEAAASLSDDAAEKIDSASYEVLEETDDTAAVEVSAPGGNPETFDLVLEDGAWKIEE